MEATEVQLGEPMSFTGVSYRNMGEGSLTGADVTQRKTAAPPYPTPAWVTKLGAWSTLHSLQAAQQVGEGPSQGLWPDLPAAPLVSVSSKQLVWSKESSLQHGFS